MSTHREEVIAFLRDHYVPLALAELAEKAAITDQIVLYGSYAYGMPHKDSDIDIAIICHGKSRVDFNGFDIMQSLREKRPECGWIQSATFEHDEIKEFRKFPITIYSKIAAAGVVLWENPDAKILRESAAAPVLSALEAKEIIKQRWLDKAKSFSFSNWRGVHKMSTSSRWFAAQDAYAGACFSMWSILYNAGIDPSSRAIRWHISRLLEVAIWAHPELVKLRKLLRWLPEKLDARRCDPTGGVSKMASKRARVAAILFYRAARKITTARA